MTSYVIYLIGLPGTGKYTIAKELSKEGYIIVDNHLINNPIFSILKDDINTSVPRYAWDSISKIREAVFDFMAYQKNSNYILTNELLNDAGDIKLYNRVLNLAKENNSIFIPVKLLISLEENERRVSSPGRKERFKSTSINKEIEKILIHIVHENLLELDVTNLSAHEAAQKIISHIKHCS